MLKYLFPGHSILFMNFQAFLYEILRQISNLSGKSSLPGIDGVEQLDFIVGWPRSPPMEHLIVDESNRPYIGLGCILDSFEKLRRHIERCSHNRLHDGGLPQIFCKSKITDLANSVFHQNIGGFQISVDNPIRMKILCTFHDLLQQPLRIAFRENPVIFVQVREKILITQLGDNIHVIAGLVNVVQFDNVLVMYFLHDFHFRVKTLQAVRIHEQLPLDNFNSH